MKRKATILVSGDILLLIAPAGKPLRQLAGDLGAKWNGVGYVFPPDLQEQLEERCLDLFGRVLVRESFSVAEAGRQPDTPNESPSQIEFDDETVVGLGADGRNPTKVSTVVRSVDPETGEILQPEDESLIVDIDLVNTENLVDVIFRDHGSTFSPIMDPAPRPQFLVSGSTSIVQHLQS